MEWFISLEWVDFLIRPPPPPNVIAEPLRGISMKDRGRKRLGEQEGGRWMGKGAVDDGERERRMLWWNYPSSTAQEAAAPSSTQYLGSSFSNMHKYKCKISNFFQLFSDGLKYIGDHRIHKFYLGTRMQHVNNGSCNMDADPKHLHILHSSQMTESGSRATFMLWFINVFNGNIWCHVQTRDQLLKLDKLWKNTEGSLTLW